jgi:aldose sugar dehydrogenase
VSADTIRVTRRTPTLFLAFAVTAALLASGSPASAGGISAVRVVDCRQANPECWPTAFAFTPNEKHVFYVERFTGQIRRFTLGTGHDTLWTRIRNVRQGSEQGLLGLALDPDWGSSQMQRWVYAFYTNAAAGENQIVRLRKGDGGGVQRQVLLRIDLDLPAENHNGGVIHFGPDEKLYAVTGDQGQDPGRSQDLQDDAGKVLRINQNGSRPSDNPLAGSNAYSYGHRNSFGLTFDPQTGNVWQTENGPQCDDEINLVFPGENYGWGDDSVCPGTSESGPDPQQPEEAYTPTIVPTGAVFCEGCGLGAAAEGDLLFSAFGPNQIHHLQLDAERDDTIDDDVLYTHDQGVLGMERRQGGRIYFSDSTGIFRLQ